MPEDVEVGDGDVGSAEGLGEDQPGIVVQPRALGVGQGRQQSPFGLPPRRGKLLPVFVQCLADARWDLCRVEPGRGRIHHPRGFGQVHRGQGGDQEIPTCSVGDDTGQTRAQAVVLAILLPRRAPRPGVPHPILGQDRSSERPYRLGVAVGGGVEVDQHRTVRFPDPESRQHTIWRARVVAGGQGSGGDGDADRGHCGQLDDRLSDLPSVLVTGGLIQRIHHHPHSTIWRRSERIDQIAQLRPALLAHLRHQHSHRGQEMLEVCALGVERQPRRGRQIRSSRPRGGPQVEGRTSHHRRLPRTRTPGHHQRPARRLNRQEHLLDPLPGSEAAFEQITTTSAVALPLRAHLKMLPRVLQAGPDHHPPVHRLRHSRAG